MNTAPHSPLCWVISDGRRGIENQALGLAEAMARTAPLDIETKQISNTGLFKALPPRLQYAIKPEPGGYGFGDACPDIAIGCGRQAIAPLLALRKTGTFTIYVQDPRMSAKAFDLVVAPMHDKVSGDNVISMIGSPNRITDDILKDAQHAFAPQLAAYPGPRVCALIGGHSKTHKLTKSALSEYLKCFEALAQTHHSLLITTSRRTPKFAQDQLTALGAAHEKVWVWDGEGDNPYFAFLSAADAILVTEDSTNMLTEACAAGKPVYTLAMDGAPGKFARLYQDLASAYGVTAFTGQIRVTQQTPLRQTERVAADIWRAMQKRR